MNVGHELKVLVAESGENKCFAVYEANHYFHRCADGRVWNEKSGTRTRYQFEGPSGRHTVSARKGDPVKRARIHWAGFAGITVESARFEPVNFHFKRTYYC